jgi:trehalose 6-phosphate synthase/phosphatase
MLVELAGRTVHVKALPIGIPFERFVRLAETAQNHLNDTEKVKIIIGVDRLDYTKGTVDFDILPYPSKILVQTP